jgi:histidinol-phosphate aminotransferase
VGFLDYYKQFQELSPEEVSEDFRRQAEERRSRELAVIRTLDLTATTWWQPPHPEVVNAATFALRRAMNVYPDPGASTAREALAARLGVEPPQVVVGHGAGELLQLCLDVLLHDGGSVVVPWPSWPVLPAMVDRAGGRPVQVPLAPDQAIDLAAVHAAVDADTRAVIVCTPNDPTGMALDASSLDALARALPERCWLLVDEALAEFRDEGPVTGLARECPNVICFRSFSKAHAMAGFRVGYAVGPSGSERLLANLAPVQGVNAPAQDGVSWALEEGEPLVERRRAAARRERDRLAEALRDTTLSFSPSQAPFVWLRSSEHPGTRIHNHLSAREIQVMPGRSWGDEDHVRIQLRDPATTSRLADALLEGI